MNLGVVVLVELGRDILKRKRDFGERVPEAVDVDVAALVASDALEGG